MFLGTDVSIDYKPTKEERVEIEGDFPKAFKKLELGTWDAMPGAVCDILGCDYGNYEYTTGVSEKTLKRIFPAFRKQHTKIHYGEVSAFDQMAHFTDILFAARKLGCSVTLKRA